MDTLSAVTLAGETACALFDMLVDYIDDVDFLLSGVFHAFKERSCYVHRVTFFTLGTAVKNKYFHSVFSPSASQFYADIFIINPCESHVNPRSAEWIFSMLFLLSGFGEWWLSPELPAHCIHSSCVHNVQSLLGVNLRFNFCFLPSSLARFIFPFLMFGVQGVETSCKLSIGAFNFLKL